MKPAKMKLLSLDFDGVTHPGHDTIHFDPNRAAAMPGPILLAQLKAQGRFVWVPQLIESLRGSENVAILIHSTWRRRMPDRTLRDFLGEAGSRVIILDGQIEGRESMTHDEYVAAACQIIEPDEVLVIDDRPELFSGGLIKSLSIPVNFVWCDPTTGLSDARATAALHEWALELPHLTNTAVHSPAG